MTKITRRALRYALAAGVSVMFAGFAVAAPEVPNPNAKPLTAPQLLQLFGDKTWKWGEGGGYFDLDRRVFRARTVDASGESTAKGKWRITDTGKLCFRATWTTAAGKSSDDTCFQHVLVGNGDIYQRKLPDGEWYVFKHAKADPADEFNKLVRQDLVGDL